jgi:hypothetical protein
MEVKHEIYGIGGGNCVGSEWRPARGMRSRRQQVGIRRRNLGNRKLQPVGRKRHHRRERQLERRIQRRDLKGQHGQEALEPEQPEQPEQLRHEQVITSAPVFRTPG